MRAAFDIGVLFLIIDEGTWDDLESGMLGEYLHPSGKFVCLHFISGENASHEF